MMNWKGFEMKKMLLIVCLVSILFTIGCESTKLDGFIIGAGFVDTDTEFAGQKTKVRGVMPFVGIIIKNK